MSFQSLVQNRILVPDVSFPIFKVLYTVTKLQITGKNNIFLSQIMTENNATEYQHNILILEEIFLKTPVPTQQTKL